MKPLAINTLIEQLQEHGERGLGVEHTLCKEAADALQSLTQKEPIYLYRRQDGLYEPVFREKIADPEPTQEQDALEWARATAETWRRYASGLEAKLTALKHLDKTKQDRIMELADKYAAVSALRRDLYFDTLRRKSEARTVLEQEVRRER